MRPRAALLALFALGCLLMLGARAQAAYDPVASGATRITLDPQFMSLLKRNGVTLKAQGTAKLQGRSLSLPVSGGKFDPVAAKGTVEQEGTLLFTGPQGSIPLRSLQLKTTQEHAPFSAKLGGSQLKLLSAKSLTVSRRGFGERIAAASLALTAKAAGRLAKKLHLPGVFAPGQPLGSSLTTTQPATVTVEQAGRATLTLSAEFVSQLEGLFVAANPIFPAEHSGPVFTLPIAAGALAPDASAGTLQLGGSLELLQLGGGQVFWHEPGLDFATKTAGAEVDLEPSPPQPGKLGPVPLADLSYSAASVSSDPVVRTVGVTGGGLVLQPATAAALNQAFAGGAAVFRAGEPLGTISFLADVQ